MEIRISEQVSGFLRQLPPVPKKRVKTALKQLNHLEGDLKDLEHPLDGYCRLLVHSFRVIIKIQADHMDCLFIERRSIVYEIFEQTLLG